VLFAFVCCMLLIIVAVAMRKPPNYVIMHNVLVTARISPYSFRALVKDPETAEWNEFVITSCPDFEPTREIQSGVTLKLLQYVEDRTNSCDELDGKFAGYILLRDEYGNPIVASHSGPSATSKSNASPAAP
jgi:hypothetical protein